VNVIPLDMLLGSMAASKGDAIARAPRVFGCLRRL
jgi:hypothetical protein